MRINKKARAGIVAGTAAAAAVAVVALLGTASASAADSTPTPGSSSSSPAPLPPTVDRPMETELTGDTAAKVQAAVAAKYPDATIDRMETDADGQGVYEAHLTQVDGTHVTVFLDESFAITGEADGMGGPAGPAGRHAEGTEGASA